MSDFESFVRKIGFFGAQSSPNRKFNRYQSAGRCSASATIEHQNIELLTTTTTMSELYNPKEKADILQRAQGLRKIRQIEFDQYDISVFVEGKRKLPSCAANAFTAWLQDKKERDGYSPDWVCFTSWFGPLLTHMVKKGGLAGKFDKQVFSAVSIPRNITQREHLLMETLVRYQWGWCRS